MTNPTTIQSFIQRWRASGAGERANFQQFAVELCDLLGVDRPDPTRPDEVDNAYVFEKSVPLPHGSTGRIDLYRRGHFVMEAKQGVDARFGRRSASRRARIQDLLETLVLLGQARPVDGERYVGG